MSPSPRRRLHWAVPAAVVALVAGLATVPALAAAPPPTLPPLTPQQLLAKVRAAAPPRSLSGTVRLTPNLGIPSAGQLTSRLGDSPLAGLLTAPQESRVWFDGPGRARIALLDQLRESTLVVNGQDVWTWQSQGAKATHVRRPAPSEGKPEQQATEEAGPGAKTPPELAQELVATMDPTTALSVRSPDRVAGRPVYELVLAPRSATSTIHEVAIAVDSATSLPMRVVVTAKGVAKPVVEVGFSKISFAKPDPSLFKFKPPPGAHVTERAAGDHAAAPPEAPAPTADHRDSNHGTEPTVVGDHWESVVVANSVTVPPELAGLVSKAGSPVRGPFGAGRLVHTNLFNAIVTDNGRVAVGAVTAPALESALSSAH